MKRMELWIPIGMRTLVECNSESQTNKRIIEERRTNASKEMAIAIRIRRKAAKS